MEFILKVIMTNQIAMLTYWMKDEFTNRSIRWVGSSLGTLMLKICSNLIARQKVSS